MSNLHKERSEFNLKLNQLRQRLNAGNNSTGPNTMREQDANEMKPPNRPIIDNSRGEKHFASRYDVRGLESRYIP